MKLKRLPKDKWIVVVEKDEISFSSTEDACDWLIGLGIKDEEIDTALVDIYALGHNVAEFGIDGTLMYTTGSK